MSANRDAPVSLGFALPAAWETHARTWMAWPCRKELWRDGLVGAQAAYAHTARAIAALEPVIMVARPEDANAARLACGPAVEIVTFALDDSWMRDIAPHFVVGPGAEASRPVAGVHWNFNAWGNKYAGYAGDAAFGRFALKRAGMHRFAGDMVLEGGAIAVDGDGTLMATEECLLNPNRNPELTQSDVEQQLALCLGIRKVVWLDQGLAGDETDGHVDNIAAFAPGRRVLLAMPPVSDTENRARMEENRRRLSEAHTARGEALEIVPVPLPRPRFGADGRPLTLSYLNFYIANGGLVIPSFDDPADVEAARLIAQCFPDRTVTQLDALPILVGGGGLHCITYEEPIGRAWKGPS